MRKLINTPQIEEGTRASGVHSAGGGGWEGVTGEEEGGAETPSLRCSLAVTAFLELGVWDPARVYRSVKREKGKLVYPELTIQQILWRI